MRSRRSSLLAALAAVAAIVFAQAAIALANQNAGQSPCHDAAPANFCAVHCENNDLTLDTPRVKVPAAAPAPAPVVVDAPRYPQAAPVRIAVRAAGPPLHILFQNFRI